MDFKPMLGSYIKFLLTRPDQFRVVEGTGPGLYTIEDVTGNKTVVAPSWEEIAAAKGKGKLKGKGKGKSKDKEGKGKEFLWKGKGKAKDGGPPWAVKGKSKSKSSDARKGSKNGTKGRRLSPQQPAVPPPATLTGDEDWEEVGVEAADADGSSWAQEDEEEAAPEEAFAPEELAEMEAEAEAAMEEEFAPMEADAEGVSYDDEAEEDAAAAPASGRGSLISALLLG